MATAGELSADEVAALRAAARRRQDDERKELEDRERRAWTLAREVAVVLRAHFPVERVEVFGSLVHPGCFTRWSDVDITVWGLRPADTLRAIGMAMDLGDEIAVNLVDVGTGSASLRQTIEQEGVPL